MMARRLEQSAQVTVEADLRAVHHVGERYKLAVPRSPICGALGEMMGSSSGSSLEFQDFREYVPGDDPRHIDWSALGRSDQLMVRLYREEVAPFADILIDGSSSMAVGEGHKQRVGRELTLAFDLFALRAGAQPSVWLLGDEPVKVEGADRLKLSQLGFGARASFENIRRAGLGFLKRRSIRVVISDFLFVHQSEVLVKQLAEGASALWLIQVLTAEEAEPQAGGGFRLTDAETQEYEDLILNERTTADYLRRLTNLQTGLYRAARRAGARFVNVRAEDSLDDICRNALLSIGVIEAS